jgi:hypothetical protein
LLGAPAGAGRHSTSITAQFAPPPASDLCVIVQDALQTSDLADRVDSLASNLAVTFGDRVGRSEDLGFADRDIAMRNDFGHQNALRVSDFSY